MVENYCRIDGPQNQLVLLRSKSFCPKVWFNLDPFETTVTLSRHSLGPGQGQYVDARFKSRSAAQVIDFYDKLAAAFPEIRLTYEYMAPCVVAYGTASVPPVENYFSSESELVAIRSVRQWKLPLTVDPKQLISDFIKHVPIRPFNYDEQGDCIMIGI